MSSKHALNLNSLIEMLAQCLHQLKNFGLNPSDWRTSCEGSREFNVLCFEHREDSDVRLHAHLARQPSGTWSIASLKVVSF